MNVKKKKMATIAIIDTLPRVKERRRTWDIFN
jgi:hypothetical protein